MAVKELAALRELVGEIQDLNSAQHLLGWDMETYMPENGSEGRAKQLATLSKLSHNMMTSAQMGELLAQLRDTKMFQQLEWLDQAIVREIGKEYDRAKKLPVSLVQEMTETTAKAHKIWVDARRANDFQQFAPVLREIVRLNRQMADALGYQGSPYNALMDLYEPGLTTEQVDALFANLKPELIALVKAISESPVKPDVSMLKRVSNVEKQWQFSEMVIQRMGFDLESGRLDKAPHPFCSGIGMGDVRLTTRVFKDDLLSCLFSTIHEAGHGLYEQGVDSALARTPLTGGASLGIHESQSRMWENVIGRSRPFWKYFLPKLRKAFPRQLGSITLNQFYQAINRSQPSFIRVESDEATYNLHILLRYEIEKDLIEGRIEVEDIPALWSRKMQEYFGITPPNDALGALQDVHWSGGMFGYFPTYTLGNLYSVQFYNQAKKEIPSLEDQIAKGNFKALKQWLNEKIHRYSRAELPEEIVRRVTGEPLNAQYFVDYLWNKYGEIYQFQRSTAQTAPALA